MSARVCAPGRESADARLGHGALVPVPTHASALRPRIILPFAHAAFNATHSLVLRLPKSSPPTQAAAAATYAQGGRHVRRHGAGDHARLHRGLEKRPNPK
eukprot:351354-Chlamydomonas_euryale.AAC.2